MAFCYIHFFCLQIFEQSESSKINYWSTNNYLINSYKVDNIFSINSN
jgi:hypothetical protein